jgi:hypothetical protein
MFAAGYSKRRQPFWYAAAIVVVCSSALQAAPVVQETPSAAVADSERDFDRLDAAAGLRSGGAFPFDFQHLVFFDVDGEGIPSPVAELWTAASVQANRLRTYFDDGWNYSLDLTVSLFDADTIVATSQTRVSYSLPSRVKPDNDDGLPVHALLRVPPGEYDYRMVIRDNNYGDDRSVNEKQGRLVVPAPVATQPFVSSVAIAADSGGSWSPASDVKLMLNAARIVQNDGRPYVYFEAYGLTPGSSYRGEVRLVSRWVSRGQGERFEGAYQPFQLQYRGSVPTDPSEPVRELLRLDLTNTHAGPYEVQIRVRDLETGRVSEVRSARLKVRDPDHRRPVDPIAEGR